MTLLDFVATTLTGVNPAVVAALAALIGAMAYVLLRSLVQPLPSTKSDEKAATTTGEEDVMGYDSMGPIESLTDLDYKTEKPERIYKFADKYNLTMGLRKTTVNTITRIDQQFVERIEERKKILKKYPGALGCIPSGEPMVRDFYTFLVTHYLPKRYPTCFTIGKKGLHNKILDEHLSLTPPTDIIDVLRVIALTVDEDFLMLQPDSDGDGYQLTAFVWMYPVGFDPVDKLGIKLRDAHGPVPGYKQHLQMSMERYFNRLTPGRVVDRINWAVATNASLCERGEYHLYDEAMLVMVERPMRFPAMRASPRRSTLMTHGCVASCRHYLLSHAMMLVSYLYPLSNPGDQASRSCR